MRELKLQGAKGLCIELPNFEVWKFTREPSQPFPALKQLLFDERFIINRILSRGICSEFLDIFKSNAPNFLLPWKSRDMFSKHYHIALLLKLKLYFEERGILLSFRPVELKEDWWGPWVNQPALLDFLIILELISVQLQPCPAEMDLGRANRP